MLYIPLLYLKDEGILINSVYKITRNYQKQIRKSDLSSLLSSENYVNLIRNDNNLSNPFITFYFYIEIFPFKDIDSDIQPFGQCGSLHMNYILPSLKVQLENSDSNIIKQKVLEISLKLEEEKTNKIININTIINGIKFNK